MTVLNADNQTIIVHNSGSIYKNPIEYKSNNGTTNIRIGDQFFAKNATLPNPVNDNTLDFVTYRTTIGGAAFSGTIILEGYTFVAVTDVTASPTILELEVGGEIGTLAVIVSPANATNKDVIWSSSNTSIARVYSSGMVFPVSAGDAIITVETVNGGLTATCVVKVTDPVGNDSVHSTAFSAYPNPASGVVTVKGLTIGKTIKIYNVTGALVGSHIAQGEEMTINIDNLSSGIYILTIEGQIIKVIKN